MMMTGIAMLAILLDRRAAPLRLVMLSAAIVMLIAPDAMLGPSFQMSFAAVFCLIAAHERRFEFLFAPDAAIVHAGPVRWIIGHFGLIMMTSLIATAATTPFAIYHFQTFSFYGFIANMLAIPLTSFWVMPCILMAYLTAPFGLDGWFIDGAGAGIALTIKIALTVASWPFSIFYLPAMPAFVLVMIVLGGLWLCLWQKRWRYLGLIPILIGAFYPFYTPKPDIMIAPDASEWAARLDDGTLAVSNLDRATLSPASGSSGSAMCRWWMSRQFRLPRRNCAAMRRAASTGTVPIVWHSPNCLRRCAKIARMPLSSSHLS